MAARGDDPSGPAGGIVSAINGVRGNEPAVYTIAAGDERDDLTLTHFSVVDENRTA